MVYQFIQILNSRILINIFVTMGPIEKKINEVLNTENLSEETKSILISLVNEVRILEKDLVNRSYQQGVYDKEIGKPITWNHYWAKYESYLSTMKIGEYK